ncbi:MAG: hypothetical protein ACK5LP_07750 [Campylobacteraceae bacterium]
MEKSVKLRAFKIENSKLSAANSGLYVDLSAQLNGSLKIAKDRLMRLSYEDDNKEEDLMSYFDISTKEKNIFGTMIRILKGNEVEHIPEILFNKEMFDIDSLDHEKLDTNAIYKDHYFFLLSNNFLVTNLSGNITIKRLQTYLNFILNASYEITPVIIKNLEIRLSEIKQVKFQDPVGDKARSDIQNKQLNLKGWVLENILDILSIKDGDLDLSKLEDIVSARLSISFKKPRKMSEDEYSKSIGAMLKPVSDTENISFTDRSGNTIKADEMLKVKPVKIDVTTSGKLSEQDIKQEMSKFLGEIEDEKKMKQNILIKTILLAISITIVLFATLEVDKEFISTLYTVAGIMFSVGIGLIVSSNFDGVRNKEILYSLRARLDRVKRRFIIFFTLSTVCFVAFSYTPNQLFEDSFIKVNLHLLFCVVLLVSIGYFVVNFLAIQRLKNDIADIVLNEG